MACCKVCCGCKDCVEAEEGKCCCGEGSAATCCDPGTYCCSGACVELCGEGGQGPCKCGSSCCEEGEYCCDDGCNGSPCCTVCVYYSEDDCGYSVPTWDCSLTQAVCEEYGGTFHTTNNVVTIPAYAAKPASNCSASEQEFGPYDVNPCDCTYEESPP